MVRHAIIEAVRGRMGAAAVVRIDRLTVVRASANEVASMTAVPEPGSRAGRLVRFTLMAPGSGEARPTDRYLGTATAELHVALPHLRASQPVARGTLLAASDVCASTEDVGVAALSPPPSVDQVVGGRAVRDLLAGEILTTALVRAQPLVRSGDTVITRARVGQVEILGRAVAQQSGGRHDRIRLVNPESRRTLFGRVTGAGEVEVMHVL